MPVERRARVCDHCAVLSPAASTRKLRIPQERTFVSARKVQYLNPEGACPAQGLYSHVGKVDSGPLLFIAGQLAVDGNGGVVGRHDFDAQFAQVFANLGAVLKGCGGGYQDVVKFTTYLVHSQDIDKFMRLRAQL